MFYKTFRAYYISLFYLANKKYSEAVAFCFKVENYIKQVEASLGKISNQSDLAKQKSGYQAEIKGLKNEVDQSKYKIQTAALLKDDFNETADQKDKEANKEKLQKIVIRFKYSLKRNDINFFYF